MKRKTNAKSKKRQMAARSKLKTRRAGKGKKRAAGLRKSKPSGAKMPSSPARKIVRIMGQGQFNVDGKTLKKLNDLDNSIVELVSQERSDDTLFKEKLAQLSEMVVSRGKPLDPKEIIQSDIILPSADLSLDEAKRLFKGEGVIPEL